MGDYGTLALIWMAVNLKKNDVVTLPHMLARKIMTL